MASPKKKRIVRRKRIGIVGTRRRDNLKAQARVTVAFFEIYEKGDIIVSGGCPKGGDRFAEIIAQNHDISSKIFPANWSKYGKKAGFVRNTLIAKYATHLIACVAKDRKGGTEDTIRKFVEFHGTKNLILLKSKKSHEKGGEDV